MKIVSRQLIRSVSATLTVLILVQLSPVPALAARGPVQDVAAQIAKDREVLETEGKEAYLDRLFERLAADEARAKEFVERKVHQVGAKKLAMMILAIGSPVLAAVLAVVPESWQTKIVVGALNGFIGKAIRQIKKAVSGMSQAALATGLAAVGKVLGEPGAAASALRGEGQSWWEKFFGNSTVVRNFLVCVVVVSSIGVAVGLAIAGASTAPIIAVVGALVSLIALIAGPAGLHAD